MKDFSSLFALVNQLSSLVDCGDCRLCEGESVYLMPWELRNFKTANAKIIDINSVYYLQHNDRDCQYFKSNHDCKQCGIYEDRPFCCRLYPLGIFDDNGTAKWGVYKHCPSVKNIPFIMFKLFSEMLEKELGYDNCLYLQKEDQTGALIEGLKGEGRFHRTKARFDFVRTVSILKRHPHHHIVDSHVRQAGDVVSYQPAIPDLS